MPNKVESECPVCKQPAKAAPRRTKRKSWVSLEMNLVCLECKLFWTPDLGWKPIPKSMRSKMLHKLMEDMD